MDTVMQWLDMMFGNDVGLLSMIVLIVAIGMMVWFAFFFVRKMKESEQNEM